MPNKLEESILQWKHRDNCTCCKTKEKEKTEFNPDNLPLENDVTEAFLHYPTVQMKWKDFNSTVVTDQDEDQPEAVGKRGKKGKGKGKAEGAAAAAGAAGPGVMAPGVMTPAGMVMAGPVGQAGPKKRKSKKHSAQRREEELLRLGQCAHPHLMFKSPAEVLRDMDEQRERMALEAELTDLIERKLARMHERDYDCTGRRLCACAVRKVRKQAMLRPGPAWYQELSSGQMNTAELLGAALHADMEEGRTERTRRLLCELGLHPAPSRMQVAHAMRHCFTCPVLFLFCISRCMEPRVRPTTRSGEPLYAVRERLALSALAHLALPRTLVDLHVLLGPTHRPPRTPPLQRPRRPPRRHCRCRCRSVYLEPLPVQIADAQPKHRDWAPPPEDRERALDLVRMRARSWLGSHWHTLALDPDAEERLAHARQTLTTLDEERRRVRLPSQPPHAHAPGQALLLVGGDERERERTVHRLLSTLPRLADSSPLEGPDPGLLRFCTSSEPPDMSNAPCLPLQTAAPDCADSGDSPAFRPMDSFHQCLRAWAGHRQSWARGSIVPPMRELYEEDVEADEILRTALHGYWQAFPRTVRVHERNLRSWSDWDPLTDSKAIAALKAALTRLAREGNLLAHLPDVHLLPHIHKWLLRRAHYGLTPLRKFELSMKTHIMSYRSLFYTQNVSLPNFDLTSEKLQNLTWDHKDWFSSMAKRKKDKYYAQLKTAEVNDAREFWPAMCMEYFNNTAFRDVFFSYVPSAQRDVLAIKSGGLP